MAVTAVAPAVNAAASTLEVVRSVTVPSGAVIRSVTVVQPRQRQAANRASRMFRVFMLVLNLPING